LEGNSTWAWLYLTGEIAAFVGYVGGLLLLRRAGRVGSALVACARGGDSARSARVAACLISSDAWTYWDYGRNRVRPRRQPVHDSRRATFRSDPA
jgi:hypothetical protein